LPLLQILKCSERVNSMSNNDQKTSGTVEQPLMSTATTEAGFDRNNKKKRHAVEPKIGETIMGDDGITGRIR
jgi:hypothetical protein